MNQIKKIQLSAIKLLILTVVIFSAGITVGFYIGRIPQVVRIPDETIQNEYENMPESKLTTFLNPAEFGFETEIIGDNTIYIHRAAGFKITIPTSWKWSAYKYEDNLIGITSWDIFNKTGLDGKITIYLDKADANQEFYCPDGKPETVSVVNYKFQACYVKPVKLPGSEQWNQLFRQVNNIEFNSQIDIVQGSEEDRGKVLEAFQTLTFLD